MGYNFRFALFLQICYYKKYSCSILAHLVKVSFSRVRICAVNLYAAVLTNNQHPLQKIRDSLLETDLLLVLSTALRTKVTVRNKIHLHTGPVSHSTNASAFRSLSSQTES